MSIILSLHDLLELLAVVFVVQQDVIIAMKSCLFRNVT